MEKLIEGLIFTYNNKKGIVTGDYIIKEK